MRGKFQRGKKREERRREERIEKGTDGLFGFDCRWLGKNSSQQKFSRVLKELHLHTSLRVSGSKTEFRETYLPVLKKRLLNPLATQGADGIPEVIELMEYYYLNREDLDNVLELVHDFKRQDPWKDIPTQVKSSFTRKFNQLTHVVPYAEGVVTKGRAKAAPGPQPDLEEAAGEETFVDEEGEGEEKEGAGNNEDEESVGNDKMIKVKKTTAKKASGSGRGSGGGGSGSGSGGGRSRK